MPASAATAQSGPLDAFRRVSQAKSHNDWEAVIAIGRDLPPELDTDWARVADEVAFALGQRKRFAEGTALLIRCWAVGKTHRRASALAYLHYAACFERRAPRERRPRGGLSRSAGPTNAGATLEELRQGFRRWMDEALGLCPGSIKDLYRLGLFEAQIESAHDKLALRAFSAAIAAHDQLSVDERERRHDLKKYHLRSCYAGARSALRLGQAKLARRLAFRCIREDQTRNHLEPVHKLGLAGKICLATGELDHADRAFRLALDAKGPPRRDHLHSGVAEVYRRSGRPEQAIDWLERHVRAERRSPVIWRQLGDLLHATGNLDRAEKAYQCSLQRDRMGRHLTLVRLGDVARVRGWSKEAQRYYEQAFEFRRRRFSSEDPAALARLAELEASRAAGPSIVNVGSRHSNADTPERSSGVA